MGSTYTISTTFRFNVSKKQELVEKLSLKIMEEFTSGEVNWGDFHNPKTLEDCLGLIFSKHQNSYSLEVKTDGQEENYEVNSDFHASYGWEGLMVDYFELVAPLLSDGSELWIYPDHDYDHLEVRDGKMVRLH